MAALEMKTARLQKLDINVVNTAAHVSQDCIQIRAFDQTLVDAWTERMRREMMSVAGSSKDSDEE